MSEFRVTELMKTQSAEGAVQLEQFQTMTVQPPANQEARETRSQEKQWADMSLVSRMKMEEHKYFSVIVQVHRV